MGGRTGGGEKNKNITIRDLINLPKNDEKVSRSATVAPTQPRERGRAGSTKTVKRGGK